MSNKWVYILAVLMLLVIRFGVLNTNFDQYLLNFHFDDSARFIAALRASPPFIKYVGNWALPVFVICVLLFWFTESEDADLSKQFLLLPIAYVPFSIIGTILSTAVFEVSYLYVHPLVILPFAYLYVAFWILFIWLLTKLHIVQ